LTIVTNNFDTGGRLSMIGDGTNSATYSYLANSPLVEQIAFKQNGSNRMTTTKSFDMLNRLTSIVSRTNSVAVSSFGYAYNAANQRTLVTNADSSVWNFGYDSLGQVTSGRKYWGDSAPVAGQQFGYSFDDIGNRTQTQAGGNELGLGLRTANYSANNLNQYESRTVPGSVDIIGSATGSAIVTVNDTRTSRRGDYFRAEVGIENGTAPAFASITAKAVVGGATNLLSTVTGNTFLPQNPESFSYDADGNLTQDGRWTYSWNAENRLINMTSLGSTPTASKFKLDFVYDYSGRRLQKLVSTNSGAGYVAAYTNRFVYDGWNLQAILNPQSSVIQSFLWGLDLSGSLQGAGGVGGLLSISSPNSSELTCFDGNGNIIALVDESSSTVYAEYEYAPFGETLLITGNVAFSNPFRFGTKYTDSESALIYYGCRYYNPDSGIWISRDPLEEEGGLNLYSQLESDPVNFFDALGLRGSGHHIIPWKIFNGEVSKEVQAFFDSDLARIFNEYYKSHGADTLDGISAKAYNKLVSEELNKFLGEQALKDMTKQQAEAFLNHIVALPANNRITIYNNVVRRQAAEAMKAGLEKAALNAAESSLNRVSAAGATKAGARGSAKLSKAIPLIGTVVAVYYIVEDSKQYGVGPAFVNGTIDGTPLIGAGKVLAELYHGYRFLDVTVGPKHVSPTVGHCGGFSPGTGVENVLLHGIKYP
jgi:RHS repeat-associated protein